MSYDIELKHPVSKQPLRVDYPHHMRGGTYQLGGSHELALNITYNYGHHYYRLMGDRGIRTIYGMTGAQSIPVLEEAIKLLGNDTDPDYWKGTEGNAKVALCQLLSMAQMRPDGVWDGD